MAFCLFNCSLFAENVNVNSSIASVVSHDVRLFLNMSNFKNSETPREHTFFYGQGSEEKKGTIESGWVRLERVKEWCRHAGETQMGMLSVISQEVSQQDRGCA